MTQVSNVLDTLWTYEKVMATPILSIDEKRVVINELIASIPHPMHSSGFIGTRDIVANHLTPPSIQDEVKVGNANSPRPPTDTPVPNGHNPNKEAQGKKAGLARR